MAERYAAAAAAGFRGIEVAFPYDTPAKELAARLGDNDLQLVQILSPFAWDEGERGMAALPGREEAFRASIHHAVDYAAQVGRPMIHVMPGNMTPELDRSRCLDLFIENIAWAADVARPAGITLILEPCCRARFPQFLYHRIEEGVQVVQQVGRDNVKLCFDTFHVQMEEGAIADRLQATWPHIGHIQIGNVPGRHEPGTGEINYPNIVRTLVANKFGGWMAMEFRPLGDPLASVRAAKDMVMQAARS